LVKGTEENGNNRFGVTMDEIPNEIQWLVLCNRVRTLAQIRYCIYDLYMSGGFLFIEAKAAMMKLPNMFIPLIEKETCYESQGFEDGRNKALYSS
jgi:hypothetical protein